MRNQSFGVNQHTKKYVCKMWELSGITCVHVMAHMKMNQYLGVNEWYSQSKWFEAYQLSSKPVYGPAFWKTSTQTPPLPLVEIKMIERPRKRRIRHVTENDKEIAKEYQPNMNLEAMYEIEREEMEEHAKIRKKWEEIEKCDKLWEDMVYENQN
ncbi:hypothetical protein Tco_1206142 [Tanacetum coccineum]